MSFAVCLTGIVSKISVDSAKMLPKCHAGYNLIELDNEGCRGRVGHDTSIVYIDEYIREYLQVEFNFVRLIELSPNRRFKTEPNTAAADIALAARGHSTPHANATRS